jgi:hypothetical protein
VTIGTSSDVVGGGCTIARAFGRVSDVVEILSSARHGVRSVRHDAQRHRGTVVRGVTFE